MARASVFEVLLCFYLWDYGIINEQLPENVARVVGGFYQGWALRPSE